LDVPELARRIGPFFVKAGYEVPLGDLEKIAELLQPRLVTLDEAVEWMQFFVKDEISPTVESLVVKGIDANQALEVAEKLFVILDSAKAFTHEEIEQPIRDLASDMELKVGQVFGVLRMAITDQQVSPPLIESMDLLGREKTLERLGNAMILLKKSVEAGA
jgi:glutamyl-tRNA synthetase